MRIMPFMKRKKGVQFAGIGLDGGTTDYSNMVKITGGDRYNINESASPGDTITVEVTPPTHVLTAIPVVVQIGGNYDYDRNATYVYEAAERKIYLKVSTAQPSYYIDICWIYR